jgi:uncharacterized protein DUF3800
MYLLFLDESGTHSQSPALVLGGLAVHEHDAWRLQRRLEKRLARNLPAGSDLGLFELHASEMKSPIKPKGAKISPWAQIPVKVRMETLEATYRSLATYEAASAECPVVLFGAVVDARYKDLEQRAYEELLHRFDEMLTRRDHAGSSQQRGVVIHDERVLVEKDLQSWTDQWRKAAGRIGKLTHFADVPLFADSRASRLIQAADFVAWALWRYYGLPVADERWIKHLWPLFERDNGIMHGLVHVIPGFKSGVCSCRPCVSRLTKGAENADF